MLLTLVQANLPKRHWAPYSRTMRAAIFSMLGLGLGLSAIPGHATSQDECTIPMTNEWLRQDDRPISGARLDPAQVLPVVADLVQATKALTHRSAVLLTSAQTARFAGHRIPTTNPRRLHPYLVRAVYPVDDPVLEVRWDGDRLSVSASGLGCAPFTKRPIIVLLEHEPKRVDVIATAAL